MRAVSKLAYDALKQLGINGQRGVMRSLTEAAEKALCWVWFNCSARENKQSQKSFAHCVDFLAD